MPPASTRFLCEHVMNTNAHHVSIADNRTSGSMPFARIDIIWRFVYISTVTALHLKDMYRRSIGIYIPSLHHCFSSNHSATDAPTGPAGATAQQLRRHTWCAMPEAPVIYIPSCMFSRKAAGGTQGVTPDIVTMAKGIGNGLPLAAVVTTPEIAEVGSRACTPAHTIISRVHVRFRVIHGSRAPACRTRGHTIAAQGSDQMTAKHPEVDGSFRISIHGTATFLASCMDDPSFAPCGALHAACKAAWGLGFRVSRSVVNGARNRDREELHQQTRLTPAGSPREGRMPRLQRSAPHRDAAVQTRSCCRRP